MSAPWPSWTSSSTTSPRIPLANPCSDHRRSAADIIEDPMMKNFRTFILAAFACAFAATAALAHAFLDHAVPGVGATVSASPGELELSFTQNIVAAFSGVEIAEAGGGSVPVGKPVVDPGSPNV